MKKNYLKILGGITSLGMIFFALQSFIFTKNAPTTVTGEILDMKCYMASGAHGDGHKQCALKCINQGEPMGILAEDGQVYLLVADGHDAAPYNEAKKYAGEQVTLTGSLEKTNGVQALIVMEVKPKAS
jgi:hypothetical protein